MKIPIIRGTIDRRILANYRINPDVVARMLPAPFRPQIIKGHAIGGICLIRLKQVRPRWFPLPWGIRSENAAHRFAVEWDEAGIRRHGVYIPRRDTDSRLNAWAGGKLFPGLHHHASFTVNESAGAYSVALTSDDGETRVHVSGKAASGLPATSVFESLAEASAFFESGSLGYSATSKEGRYDGLELRCSDWKVAPMDVELMESSFFANTSQFPTGSIHFDCALVMHGVEHEWHGRGDLVGT